jgi:hypothetical protein|tara:strand:+ start:70 stop:336 length:267 start_codon:yes stop_codon:yes gene_type:complete
MGKINNETITTPAGTDRLLGSDQSTSPTGGTANYTVDSVGVYLLGDRTAVPGSTSPGFGTTGQYAVNATHFFICVATDTWKKVALSAI